MQINNGSQTLCGVNGSQILVYQHLKAIRSLTYSIKKCIILTIDL